MVIAFTTSIRTMVMACMVIMVIAFTTSIAAGWTRLVTGHFMRSHVVAVNIGLSIHAATVALRRGCVQAHLLRFTTRMTLVMVTAFTWLCPIIVIFGEPQATNVFASDSHAFVGRFESCLNLCKPIRH